MIIATAIPLIAAQSASRKLNAEKIPDIHIGVCSTSLGRQILDSPLAGSVLWDFGFDIRNGIWRCSALQVSWLHAGKVVILKTLPTEVDTGMQITIASFKTEPRLWVIPVSSGMVGYPNMADEIHNRAAFNAILARNAIHPRSPEMWTSVAMLYLNMVGVETHVADWKAHGENITGLARSPVLFKKTSLFPSSECDERDCAVTINDTRATAVTRKVTKWVLTFSVHKKGVVHLESVEHEVKLLTQFP